MGSGSAGGLEFVGATIKVMPRGGFVLTRRGQGGRGRGKKRQHESQPEFLTSDRNATVIPECIAFRQLFTSKPMKWPFLPERIETEVAPVLQALIEGDKVYINLVVDFLAQVFALFDSLPENQRPMIWPLLDHLLTQLGGRRGLAPQLETFSDASKEVFEKWRSVHAYSRQLDAKLRRSWEDLLSRGAKPVFFQLAGETLADYNFRASGSGTTAQSWPSAWIWFANGKECFGRLFGAISEDDSFIVVFNQTGFSINQAGSFCTEGQMPELSGSWLWLNPPTHPKKTILMSNAAIQADFETWLDTAMRDDYEYTIPLHEYHVSLEEWLADDNNHGLRAATGEEAEHEKMLFDYHKILQSIGFATPFDFECYEDDDSFVEAVKRLRQAEAVSIPNWPAWENVNRRLFRFAKIYCNNRTRRQLCDAPAGDKATVARPTFILVDAKTPANWLREASVA